MSPDTASLLKGIYQAYREKRIDYVADHFSEDFRFMMHLPEDVFPGAGRSLTKAETQELFSQIAEDYDFLIYDPGPIIASEGRATVQPRVRLRHKRTGNVLDTKFTHAWRFREGKAVELDEHHDVAKVSEFLKSLG